MALYHSPEYQTSFESTDLSVQEKKFKINFQDDGCDSHREHLIRTILAIFNPRHHDTTYQVTSQLVFWFRRRNSK